MNRSISLGSGVVLLGLGCLVTRGITTEVEPPIPTDESMIGTFAGSIADDLPADAPGAAHGDRHWQMLHPELANTMISDSGILELHATEGGPEATWFMDGEGPLMWTWITGDFTVAALVDVWDPQNPDQGPPPEYRLSGLTVRDPVAPPGDHDWVHVAIGSGSSAVPVAVEDKNTVDSVSDLRLYPIADTRGWVRVSRVGDEVTLYYRDDGATDWQILRTHQRPDLPNRVQIGMNLMSWQNPPDISSRFERVIFLEQ